MSSEVSSSTPQQPVHLPSPIEVAEAPAAGKPVSGGIATQKTTPPPAPPEPRTELEITAEHSARAARDAVARYRQDKKEMEAIEQSDLPRKAKQEKLEALRPSLDHHWAEAYRLTKSNFELQDLMLRPAWDALQKVKGELEQAKKGNDQQAIHAAAHKYANTYDTYIGAQQRHTEALNLKNSKYW
ncbi:hypothetical protein [Bradyrhizobium sp. CCBAU 53351]|uniref:hypothetical protein n=1 Tax=Bradyrhizobium sp. CCBAU 53351 TaxID=1325114 RepID=UPI00188767C4|nr:hypothetical protein [Bradyrhizobium sp. CCBAU 53351]